MSEEARLRDLLPSLWRPEPDDETLVKRFVGACGFVLDGAAAQAQHVLRAHWFDVADKATWDAHYQTERADRGLPPANVRDAGDLKAARLYPYIDDLARICALLDLPPWLEPASLRETVEEYRQRVGDLMDAYRLGLATPPALRRLVEAALPEDMGAPLARQRWSFAIEEPVCLRRRTIQIVVPGAQEGDLVSPLHRWKREADAAGAPTFYIQGVAADDFVAACERPALECLNPGQAPFGVALAYLDNVPAGQTLRLAPARQSWIVLDGALHRSPEETPANRAADPSANGPWAAVANPPAGSIQKLVRAADHSLWLIARDGDDWALYRHDGAAFQAIVENAPAGPYTALVARGAAVYLGTAQGLYRCDLFPAAGDPYRLAAVAAVPEATPALALLADGRLACAGSRGLVLLDAADAEVERLLPDVAPRAMHVAGERLYLATDQALLLRDQGRWFRYAGAGLSENLNDWVALEAAAAATSPLPPVNAIAQTPDGALWLGTEQGLARWTVRDELTTLLEAFPDLGTDAIADLRLDERGMLWIASAAGLLRHDGRDLARHDFAGTRWVSLGRADSLYPDEVAPRPRGHWRYAAGSWERFDSAQGRFTQIEIERRVDAGAAVAGVLFGDSLVAELGEYDGHQFNPVQALSLDRFVMRIKPDEERIVAGGPPALPAGAGHWRYLQMEPDGLTPPEGRPWWSREGRLFPPAAASAPRPGHFRGEGGSWHADGRFDRAVFAYPPSARLWQDYPARPVVGVRVRLFRRQPGEALEPALIERVWQLLTRAKAAGVPLQLAVEGATVKGD